MSIAERHAGGRFLYGGHLRANGIRQHYLRFGGTGVPLLVLPGITSPAATWDFVGETLATDRDVYVLDIRGRGLSSSGPELRYDVDTCANDVLAFAASLGWQQWDLLGHSMGARIASRAATSGPAGPRRLVLVDPPVSGPGRRAYPKPLDFYIEAIEQARAGTLEVEAVRRSYPKWTDAQVRARAEWLHTCTVEAVAQAHSDFHTHDFHADLPRLRVPALLIVAGRGGVILPADVEEIRALQPAMEMRMLLEASHMVPFDDLPGFARATLEFLRAQG